MIHAVRISLSRTPTGTLRLRASILISCQMSGLTPRIISGAGRLVVGIGVRLPVLNLGTRAVSRVGLVTGAPVVIAPVTADPGHSVSSEIRHFSQKGISP